MLCIIAACTVSSAFAYSPETSSVILKWEHPSERENGDALSKDEIGGYEIKYKKPADDEEWRILIDTNEIKQYELEIEKGALYEFSISAYDTNGLYSEQVSISYREISSPKPPTVFEAIQKILRPSFSCSVSTNCIIVEQ